MMMSHAITWWKESNSSNGFLRNLFRPSEVREFSMVSQYPLLVSYTAFPLYDEWWFTSPGERDSTSFSFVFLVPCIPCIARWILYHWATWEVLQGSFSLFPHCTLERQFLCTGILLHLLGGRGSTLIMWNSTVWEIYLFSICLFILPVWNFPYLFYIGLFIIQDYFIAHIVSALAHGSSFSQRLCSLDTLPSLPVPSLCCLLFWALTLWPQKMLQAHPAHPRNSHFSKKSYSLLLESSRKA